MQIEPWLRASDADREQVSQRLRHATAEGRLCGDELEERLEALYAARTYGELDALLVDIPASRSVAGGRVFRDRRLIGAVSAVCAVTLVAAVLGLLTIVRRRTALAIPGPERLRHLGLPAPLANQHHDLILAGSVGIALSVVLLTSVALALALMNARSQR